MFGSFPTIPRPTITGDEIIEVAKKNAFLEGTKDIQKPIKKEFGEFLKNWKPVEYKYLDFSIREVYTKIYYYNPTSTPKFSAKPKQGYKAMTNLAAHPNHGVRFPMYVDDHYINQFNSTFIPDEQFILSAGPQDDKELESFLKTHVFNKNEKLRTKKIIALGTKEREDFVDYFSARTSQRCGDLTLNVDEKAVKRLPYAKVADFCGITILEIINSQLRVSVEKQEKVVDVTLIPMQDNGVIDITEDSVKDLIAELASLKENLLLHCAAGIGRTGHLALILLILRHARDIFRAETPEQAYHFIIQLVGKLREKRICMIANELQFHYAIRNAYQIYSYQLKKQPKLEDEKPEFKPEPLFLDFCKEEQCLALSFTNEKKMNAFVKQYELKDEKVCYSKLGKESIVYLKLRFIPQNNEYALDFSTPAKLDQLLQQLQLKPANINGKVLSNGQTMFNYPSLGCRRFKGAREKGGRDQGGSLYFSGPQFAENFSLKIAPGGVITPVLVESTPKLKMSS